MLFKNRSIVLAIALGVAAGTGCGLSVEDGSSIRSQTSGSPNLDGSLPSSLSSPVSSGSLSDGDGSCGEFIASIRESEGPVIINLERLIKNGLGEGTPLISEPSITRSCLVEAALPGQIFDPDQGGGEEVAVSAGRFGGVPWIVYVYPARYEEGSDSTGHAAVITTFNSDGGVSGTKRIGYLGGYEGTITNISAIIQSPEILLCNQDIELFEYDPESGDIIGQLSEPKRAECVRSKVPFPAKN